MSSEKYIENVTIQYLLKPNLQNQIIKNNTILRIFSNYIFLEHIILF